jgi:hypothetical protein
LAPADTPIKSWLLITYFLASNWKILYQQRNQRNAAREQEQEVKRAMMEKEADCRLPLKAGQAVGAWGISYFDCNYITIFTWKACFVQGLNVYSAHFFYTYPYRPVFNPL